MAATYSTSTFPNQISLSPEGTDPEGLRQNFKPDVLCGDSWVGPQNSISLQSRQSGQNCYRVEHCQCVTYPGSHRQQAEERWYDWSWREAYSEMVCELVYRSDYTSQKCCHGLGGRYQVCTSKYLCCRWVYGLLWKQHGLSWGPGFMDFDWKPMLRLSSWYWRLGLRFFFLFVSLFLVLGCNHICSFMRYTSFFMWRFGLRECRILCITVKISEISLLIY